MKLYIFDFDGVLAIPYTNPERYYNNIPFLISSLAMNNYLAVVSFNPQAEKVIKRWGLSKHFMAYRSGYNEIWNGNYKSEYRMNMSKSGQIKSILNNELKDIEFEEILFYDDDIRNIRDVRSVFSNITSILINELYGLTININNEDRLLKLQEIVEMFEEEKKNCGCFSVFSEEKTNTKLKWTFLDKTKREEFKENVKQYYIPFELSGTLTSKNNQCVFILNEPYKTFSNGFGGKIYETIVKEIIISNVDIKNQNFIFKGKCELWFNGREIHENVIILSVDNENLKKRRLNI